MSIDRLTITNQGLLNINRKLVNERKFAQSLLTTVGEATIENGVASDFTKESYVSKGGLQIEGDKLTISFEGTFVTSLDNSNQVAWYLAGTKNPCFLQFVGVNPQLVLPNGSTLYFDYLNFKDEMPFKIITTLTATSCEVIVDIYNEVFSKVITLSSAIDWSSFTTIYLGNDPTSFEEQSNYFWEGSINVKNFSISLNDETYFTPTTGYSLKFTDLLINDGSYSLPQDTPLNISGHMYYYPIEEITRSGNNLLLVSHLDEESKLTIREIGLYAEVDGRSFLFGYIKNLNVNKGSNVPYDLFLTVNLTMSIVNVVGFPNADSFILKQIKSALLKDYRLTTDVNSYVIGNLERIIKMNSLQPTPLIGYNYRTAVVTENESGHPYDIEYVDGIECCTNPTSISSIGHNTPQVVYRVQKEISEAEDCYSSVQTYSKLRKNITRATETIFNDISIEKIGDIQVSGTGRITNFSENDYITLSTFLEKEKAWTLNFAFTINDFFSSNRTILALSSTTYPDEDLEDTSELRVRNNSMAFKPYVSFDIDTSNNLVASYYQNNVHLYAWVDWVDPLNPKIVYTTTSTVSSDSTLYDASYQVVTPSSLTFHIVQSGGGYKIQYRTHDTVRTEKFDLIYYTNLTTETILEGVNEHRRCSVKATYNPLNSTSLNLVITQNEVATTKTITIPAITTDINEITVGVDYSCDNSFFNISSTTSEDTKYILGQFSTSDPLKNSYIALVDWNITQEDNNWEPYERVVTKDANLVQYFHIPDYSKLSYMLQDICNPEYTIYVNEDFIQGNKDLIDFKNNDKFSLCLKVNLKNVNFNLKSDALSREVETRVIIAKLNEYNEPLFKLELTKNPIIDESGKETFNFLLAFTLATGSTPIVLTPKNLITLEGISEYTESPILLTITKTAQGLSMYRNNQLIAIDLTPPQNLPMYSRGHLTNYTQAVTNTDRYVKDIIGITGLITSSELYYITNLTDTNYDFNNLSNIKNLEDVSKQ